MSDFVDEKDEFRRSRRHRGPSLFGPIVLIAIGVYFLLYNLGLVSGLNWVGALQLWPLLLILLGINIIVRQAPGVLGTLLSGLVGLLAVVVFGYVLLLGEDNPVLNRLGVPGSADLQTAPIEFAADDVESAVITIDLSLPGAEVYALEDSSNLIEGTVSYVGDLIFETDVSGGQATVTLETRGGSRWFFNPSHWFNFSDEHRWQIGLNPNVATDLTFNMGAGSAGLELSRLMLSRLEIDGGAGSTRVALPGGDYDVVYQVGAGSTQMTLPESGNHTIEIDGGAGSINLVLPATMEARVEMDSGLGSFNLDEDRFTRISGEGPDEGVWETAGYDDAQDRVNLLINIGAGSVNLRQE